MKVRRRDFISLLGGAAAAWPLAARAQQAALPVVGFLGGESPALAAESVRSFKQGLSEAGYVDGQSVAIEYRWAEGHYDRLPELAADLVRLRPVVIATAGAVPAAQAAKAATTTIPIVFTIGGNPVRSGLVTSLNRPGANITGVTSLGGELVPKRLELLHEVIPTATVLGLLINPTNSAQDATFVESMQAAGRSLGVQIAVLRASAESDFEPTFEAAGLHAGGLVIVADAFFNARIEQLAQLSVRHRVPTIYEYEFAAAGGLMSYSASLTENFRLAGTYAGRILKGSKPSDLPVQQATKFDLIINLKTAKALGLTVPITLLGRADEVIE